MSQTGHSLSRLIGVAFPIGLLVLCISLLLWAYPLAAGQTPLAAAGDWQIQAVDAANNVGRWTSLALDRNDAPHISYQSASGGPALHYARWTGTEWATQTVDPQAGGGEGCALTLDAAGRPHIVYYVSSSGNNILRYARWTGAAWQIETLSGASGPPDLALDAIDQPHIYRDSGNRRLKYARGDGPAYPTSTPIVSATPSLTATATRTPTPTATVQTATPTRTATWARTATSAVSPTPTATVVLLRSYLPLVLVAEPTPAPPTITPTTTPSSTATRTPSATVTPTTTATPTATPPVSDGCTFADDFHNAGSGWPIILSGPPLASYAPASSPILYLVSTAQTFSGMAPFFTASHPRTWCANSRIEIDQAVQGSGFAAGQMALWGIVFRYQDASNYYYYRVSKGSGGCGSYSLLKVVNGQSTDLLPPFQSDCRLSNTRHTLFVSTRGDRITVGIVQNGIDSVLATAQDASLTTGYSGMRDSITYTVNGGGASMDVLYYRFTQRPVQ